VVSNKERLMAYVDGFVLAVPVEKLAEYKKLARKSGEVWREHGALEFVECVGDDVPKGKLTSFTRAVKLEEGETVVFSYIVYKNRKHRDQVNKKVMEDPRLKAMMVPGAMPFDAKRMIFGGFKTIVQM
jgi:uncharacterized protein YbaA (DUF1428 family)